MEYPEQDLARLEQALISAGKSIRYPVTPPLAARFGAQQTPLRRSILLPRWVMPAVVAIAVALAMLLIFPGTREAVAEFLGLRTIRIIPTTPSPTLPVTPGASSATPAGTRTLPRSTRCCETTLADAQRRGRFKILLPPGESPTGVYLQDLPQFFGGAQQVILVFGDPAAPRLTMYQATDAVYGKLVGLGTVVEETTVKGERALWLTGAAHVLVFLDSKGSPQFSPERAVTANTLSWESGKVTYRIETDLGKREAIRFAESLR